MSIIKTDLADKLQELMRIARRNMQLEGMNPGEETLEFLVLNANNTASTTPLAPAYEPYESDAYGHAQFFARTSGELIDMTLVS